MRLEIAGIPLSITGRDFRRSLNSIENKLIRPFVLKERRDLKRRFLDVEIKYIEGLAGEESCEVDLRLDKLLRSHFYDDQNEYFEDSYGSFLKWTLLPCLIGRNINTRKLEILLKGSSDRNRIVFEKSAFVVHNRHRGMYEIKQKRRDCGFKNRRTYHLAPLRLLFRMLLNSRPGSLLLHASSIVQDGNGYIFVGRSNSGKSTTVKMLAPDRILSDDAAIIRRVNQQYQVYPNPWWNGHGNVNIADPATPAPLKAIFFISRSKKTMVRKLNYTQALSTLIYGDSFFQQAGFVDNRYGIKSLWAAGQELLRSIPAFQLDLDKKSPGFKSKFNKLLAQHGLK